MYGKKGKHSPEEEDAIMEIMVSSESPEGGSEESLAPPEGESGGRMSPDQAMSKLQEIRNMIADLESHLMA